MKSPVRQRALIAVASGAIALSTAVAVAPAATAAPNSYAYSAARWLEDQLTGGLVHNPNYGGFDDYGLSLDVFFALNQLDTRAATQARIVQAVSADVATYTTYDDGSKVTFYPGSGGKLAVAVEAAGGDASDVNGADLIGQIEKLTDDATGAIDPGLTYGGVGQTWATRALVAAGSDEADESVAFLLSKQCPNGSFLQDYAAACGSTVEVDSTAFAVIALAEAREAGHDGLADELAAAAKALASAQAADGSFVGNGTPNTNSTGLAASALRLAGQDGAAGSAAAWIVRHQVTDARAEDTALANEIGAVAYDGAAMKTGMDEGITDESRDQWIRATSQAAAGVQAQLSSTKVAVTRSGTFVAAGRAASVRATGLRPGEKYTASVVGGGTARGTVPANGVVAASVTTPAGTATRTVTVTGSRGNRAGSTSVTVLGPRKLTVAKARTKVKRAKVQKIVARGLVAGEPVRIQYRGKVVKRGVASSKGTFTYRFKVGRKTGTAKVVVRGAFAGRQGATSFKVVK
ncbi:prenyltransferase/squalene oxidase repeat-containing protein [Aeromicrobium duanguangcaii]|uniref:Terpene cyclase/mutase family protein n=1 Tax=Aeromicrobium duanguangcaii TaxID=2968086 RepID=A0ABY5KD54_9ACTN|nr:hypothetical protein [Aeromicrobium duanguangcaii]MCD9155127.1 hypothetical protein [Aeromicrobium duanguangcaii]UUI68219.1 hypothetical protein NP095_13555 [Aeromicrobium duanguangcaii]